MTTALLHTLRAAIVVVGVVVVLGSRTSGGKEQRLLRTEPAMLEDRA
jgi:hypothetical protein